MSFPAWSPSDFRPDFCRGEAFGTVTSPRTSRGQEPCIRKTLEPSGSWRAWVGADVIVGPNTASTVVRFIAED